MTSTCAGRNLGSGALVRALQSEGAELVAIVMVIRERAKSEKMPELIMLEFELGAALQIAGEKSQSGVRPVFGSLQ